MNFGFTREEQEWRREVRKFLEKETSLELVERLIEEQGCTNPHSPELYRKLAEKGYLGLTWPKKYGGQERGRIYQFIFNEEIRKSDMPFGTIDCMSISVHYSGASILEFGTEEQRQSWLPKIVRGEFTCAIGITEPDAGCDAANAELSATESDGYYILNGTKIFNLAHVTNHISVLAKTNPEAPKKHRGLSLFIVPLDSPGVTVNPTFKTIGGFRRSEVVFEDASVPKDRMLGERDRGWNYLMQAMLFERTQRPGPVELEREFEFLVEYVKKAKFQGQTLCKIPAIRYMLAEIATEIEVCRLLGEKIVWLGDVGEINLGHTSVTQIYLSEMTERCANKCLDILGLEGQLQGRDKWTSLHYRLASQWKDSRARTTAGGTTEIQKNIVAASLGLPKGK